MPQKNNNRTYVGVFGEAMLSKDRRWDVAHLVAENFDVEKFLDSIEDHDKNISDMLRYAAYEGFMMALDEFEMLINAFSELPGSVAYPNRDYPKKYLPQDGKGVPYYVPR